MQQTKTKTKENTLRQSDCSWCSVCFIHARIHHILHCWDCTDTKYWTVVIKFEIKCPELHIFHFYSLFHFFAEAETSDAEEKLFKDLFFEYNRLIRPVENNTDILRVEFGLTMSQLIDVVSDGGILGVPEKPGPD